MMFDWRTLSPAEMEIHFNPRAAVSDVEGRIAQFASRSAQAREQMPGRYDVRYGARAKETLDVHAAKGASGHPLVLFIHGGYWRGLDKSDHSFVVPSLLDAGAVVANVNYDLCPTVTLDVIVEEMANAVAFCRENASGWGADPDALYLFGHSAGAHLAAEMMLREWPPDVLPDDAIKGVAALTGVYEPEVIVHVTVNEEARVEPEIAKRRSCLDRSFRLKPNTLIAVGGDEPQGWIAQSSAFAEACAGAGVPSTLHVVDGANHFTVLERAVTAGDPLHDAVTRLWR